VSGNVYLRGCEVFNMFFLSFQMSGRYTKNERRVLHEKQQAEARKLHGETRAKDRRKEKRERERAAVRAARRKRFPSVEPLGSNAKTQPPQRRTKSASPLRGTNSPTTKKCHQCGQRGHLKRQCPERRASGPENPGPGAEPMEVDEEERVTREVLEEMDQAICLMDTSKGSGEGGSRSRERRRARPTPTKEELLEARRKYFEQQIRHPFRIVFYGCSDETTIKSRYRRMTLFTHPDKGGDKRCFELLTNVYEAALKGVQRQQEEIRRKSQPQPPFGEEEWWD
jgi:hypothetical protein